MSGPQERRLRHNKDFEEEFKNKSAEDVHRALALPDVDSILKDLQQQHGVRVSLSPNLVKKLADLKVTAPDSAALPSTCHPNDICILCDRHDICTSCDALDFCWHVDYHIVEEEEPA